MTIPALRHSLRPRPPRPAPPRLRLAATAIDTVAALGGVALTIGAGTIAYVRIRRLRGGRGGSPQAEQIARALRSRPVKLGLELLSIALPLLRNEPRGPGFRLLGLRLVDVRSGGEPTRRQRLVRTVARRLWQALHRRLPPPRAPSPATELQQARAQEAAAREAHAGDREELQRALIGIYRETRVDPASSCLRYLARVPLVAAISIPMPWSWLRQSLVDWLSGTVVVVDRRPDARRRRSIKPG